MNTQELIQKYLLGDAQTMQIASVAGDQPWICTVYFVADDDLNVYWLSLPTRRHSQEIAAHSKVAAAIPIKQDLPVIGIQLEGDAAEVTDQTTVALITKKYVDKYDAGKEFYNNFLAGKNQHKLYCLKPRLFVLFDEVHFPEDGRQEWRPGEA